MKTFIPFYGRPPLFGVASLDIGNILIILGIARFLKQSIHLVPTALKHDVVSSEPGMLALCCQNFYLGRIISRIGFH